MHQGIHGESGDLFFVTTGLWNFKDQIEANQIVLYEQKRNA